MLPRVTALHIPDGFLSLPVSAVGWITLIVLLTYALRQTRKEFGERQIPLMGVLAAFIFAAQMLNFPVAGGTSGHLLGATLAAIFVGPWAMVVVMSAVVGVQALLFQDGGLLALGFNVINMGIISGLVGFTVYAWITSLLKNTPTAKLIGAGIGAWLGVVIASGATAVELAISGTSPLDVALPAMVGVHVLIGLGEAFITAFAVGFVLQTRPDLLEQSAHTVQTGSRWVAIGFVIALTLTLVSPLANPNPDGLERVAEDKGFIEEAQDPTYTLLPDYTVPFVESEVLTTILAGIFGVLVVGGLSYGVAKFTSGSQAAESNSSDIL